MPGVRVDLVEETTPLDLQEGQGPRRQCGTDGGGAEEKVCACVVCECARVCEVCVLVCWVAGVFLRSRGKSLDYWDTLLKLGLCSVNITFTCSLLYFPPQDAGDRGLKTTVPRLLSLIADRFCLQEILAAPGRKKRPPPTHPPFFKPRSWQLLPHGFCSSNQESL